MSHPYPIFGTEDLKGDDGSIIASYDIETDAPPDLRPMLEPVPPVPSIEPVRTTRLLTGVIRLDGSYFGQPFLLLPADANRCGLNIYALSNSGSPTNADYCMIADERAKIQVPADGTPVVNTQYFRLHHAQNLVLADHTGPVWVSVAAVANSFELTWVATTK